MIKFLFFDFRDYIRIDGFVREPVQPVKNLRNPLFMAEEPWENGNMSLYGSVVKAAGRPFQMWYTVVDKSTDSFLAYAESDDGFLWHKPLFDIYSFEGKPTNIVLAKHPHGAAIIYDDRESREDWRYKMLAGYGAGPIYAYHSTDGVHWKDVWPYPVITTGPDCPIGLLRANDGRYVAYHRKFPLHRRVCRSESWDFLSWSSEPQMVLEPDAGDPPLIDFYGLGATTYGPFEIGTLWIYHVDPTDSSTMSGYQDAELAYARSGYAWHRAAQGIPFLHRGAVDSWEPGNLQCASAPLFLDEEIRYYYASTTAVHRKNWPNLPQRAGLGAASIKPDRFIGMRTCKVNGDVSKIITHPFELTSTDIHVNGKTGKNGWIRMEILSADGKPVTGYTLDECAPVRGDSLDHKILWNNGIQKVFTDDNMLKLHLTAQDAVIYSLSIKEENENSTYYTFSTIKGAFYK